VGGWDLDFSEFTTPASDLCPISYYKMYSTIGGSLVGNGRDARYTHPDTSLKKIVINPALNANNLGTHSFYIYAYFTGGSSGWSA